MPTFTLSSTTSASASLPPIGLQTDAAAAYIGVTRKTLANWRLLGEGPRYVRLGKTGSRLIYRVVDLEAFLAEHVVDAA